MGARAGSASWSGGAGYRFDVSGVWRTALQPRWLALLGVVAMLCVVFGWLGHWQLDVAKSKENPHRNTAASAPLDQVTQPQQVFRGNMVGRAVTVSGVYDAERQVLVTGKRQRGVEGVWVLTALRVPSGALVPVVRGFVPSAAGRPAPAAALAPPTGPVALSGSLQPPEPPVDADVAAPLPGQVPAADTADLVNLWGGPIYNVLVYDAAGTPGSADRPALEPVPAPPPDDGGGLGLRNAAYALQWWLFAAFAVLLWWRMVRQDALDSAAAAAAAAQPKELSTS
jgi:surfeit locus 1 family protein